MLVTSKFYQLPDEIIQTIFTQTGLEGFVNCSMVSKELQTIVERVLSNYSQSVFPSLSCTREISWVRVVQGHAYCFCGWLKRVVIMPPDFLRGRQTGKGPKGYTLEDLRKLKEFKEMKEARGIVEAWGVMAKGVGQGSDVPDMAALKNFEDWKAAAAGFSAWFEKHKERFLSVTVTEAGFGMEGFTTTIHRFAATDLVCDSDRRSELLTMICTRSGWISSINYGGKLSLTFDCMLRS